MPNKPRQDDAFRPHGSWPGGSGKRSETAEGTRAEAFWYARQVEAARPIRVRFRDGAELTAVLQWYDRTALRFGLPDGSHRIVPKAAIACLEET